MVYPGDVTLEIELDGKPYGEFTPLVIEYYRPKFCIAVGWREFRSRREVGRIYAWAIKPAESVVDFWEGDKIDSLTYEKVNLDEESSELIEELKQAGLEIEER